jgi:hypothetical protein
MDRLGDWIDRAVAGATHAKRLAEQLGGGKGDVGGVVEVSKAVA